MVYKLEDHWIGVGMAVAKLDQNIQPVDLNRRIKTHIQKHLKPSEPIENAEFSELITQEPLISIDLYV